MGREALLDRGFDLVPEFLHNPLVNARQDRCRSGRAKKNTSIIRADTGARPKRGGELNKNRGFFDIMEHLGATRSSCASCVIVGRRDVKAHECACGPWAGEVINNFYLSGIVLKNIIQNPTVSKYKSFWTTGLSKHSNQIEGSRRRERLELIFEFPHFSSKIA
jgi:hypothetical protein